MYNGKIQIKAYKEDGAYLILGLHEPLTTDLIFNQVQLILSQNNRMPKRNLLPIELPLRGLLNCVECDSTLTCSGSTGNGGKMFYYHCQRGCKVRFNAKVVNESFVELLNQFSHNENVDQAYTDLLE